MCPHRLEQPFVEHIMITIVHTDTNDTINTRLRMHTKSRNLPSPTQPYTIKTL